MPGFLGGSSSGSGGEIRFPAELIDPVTKLRVSEPQTLIDTDFEYGLQPTKWETVELINNTPSFFSKGGDTTIPNITSITTTELSREVKVTTSLAHGLAVGIPINVSGSKSLTADGAYIINSVPDIYTFTYLCKQNQLVTASIEDLYTSIVTGEFFQGSQIRIADSDGLITDALSNSTLTIKTESPHGFGVSTPFYFLNLNSTISQEFDSSNSASKAFDSSNSATAQTFDGSNTLTSYRLDLDNNAVGSGTVSSISTYNPTTNTITVQHTTENFVGKAIGTPLYHNVVSAGGYFASSPRGVVFLKSLVTSTTSGSVFQISSVPNGTAIPITNALTGTFQLANEARLFAGNNIDSITETSVNIVDDAAKTFNGENTGGQFLNNCSFSAGNVSGASGSGIADLALYAGLMVKYETTGTPPTINAGGDATNGGSVSSLVNGRTYFIDSNFQVGSSINYVVTLKEYPTSSTNINFTGTGTGTHKFTAIGIATDKDLFHIKDHGYAVNDMLRYSYPASGHFGVNDGVNELKDYYFVQTLYGSHNFSVNWTVGELSPKTQSFIGLVATQSSVTTLMVAQGFGSGLAFSVTSGTLPTGLTLNTTTGVVTGTPSNIAGYPQATVRITASDSFGSTDFVDITFQVNPAPFLYSFTSATFGTGGSAGPYGPNITQVRNAVGNPSWAATYLNQSGTQGVQYWTVPQTSTYRIETMGARGGESQCYGPRGGYGARMRGDFSLTQGQVLKIVVGQYGVGACHDGGGGGGSYVATDGNTPMIVSGGGGGGSASGGSIDAGTTQNTATNPFGQGNNTPGYGGGNCTTSGGGGGFYGDGGNCCSWGGRAFIYGSNAGTAYGGASAGSGGFGGGGTGGGTNGSGGGGGYTGGHGTCWSYASPGGASYNNGANQSNSGSAGGGEGYVSITKL